MEAVAIEQLLVLVQPHLRHTGLVPLDRLLPVLRELVRVLAPEDVAHPGAGDDLDLAPAHPNLERRQSAGEVEQVLTPIEIYSHDRDLP